MADCLVDLVLRPGSHGLAPVQARLTVVAAAQTLLGGDEPGEVDGDLVPAAMVRELAITLGLLPPDPPPAEAAVEAEPAPSAGDRGVGAEAWSPRRALADLLSVQRLTSTALAHRPHLALVDELTGALICLTDAARVRSAAIAGRGLRPPPSSPGYRPGEALDRFVRSRDRRCRFPGCRARPNSCDLDHTVPWPHGTTSADNLCCLCRHHHRLSHQAPGWSLRGLADGGLEWTTPTGQVLTTHPPRYGADDDLPYDLPPPAPPPGVPLGDVPLPVADDPPPF